jgi:hypothetical protein
MVTFLKVLIRKETLSSLNILNSDPFVHWSPREWKEGAQGFCGNPVSKVDWTHPLFPAGFFQGKGHGIGLEGVGILEGPSPSLGTWESDLHSLASVFLFENHWIEPSVVAHTCNHSTYEPEAEGLKVQGQPELR